MTRSAASRRASLAAADARWAAHLIDKKVTELTNDLLETSNSRPVGYRNTCKQVMRELGEVKAKYRDAKQAAHRAELEAGR